MLASLLSVCAPTGLCPSPVIAQHLTGKLPLLHHLEHRDHMVPEGILFFYIQASLSNLLQALPHQGMLEKSAHNLGP